MIGVYTIINNNNLFLVYLIFKSFRLERGQIRAEVLLFEINIVLLEDIIYESQQLAMIGWLLVRI